MFPPPSSLSPSLGPQPPFYSRNTAEMYDNILNKPLQLKPNISNAARHLLEGLLQKDRTKRLGCSDDFVSVCVCVYVGPEDGFNNFACVLIKPFCYSLRSGRDQGPHVLLPHQLGGPQRQEAHPSFQPQRGTFHFLTTLTHQLVTLRNSRREFLYNSLT